MLGTVLFVTLFSIVCFLNYRGLTYSIDDLGNIVNKDRFLYFDNLAKHSQKGGIFDKATPKRFIALILFIIIIVILNKIWF